MTNIIRLAYTSTLKVKEARREEVVLHTYNFYLDAWIILMAFIYNIRIELCLSSLEIAY